jgi:hypothetical protein
VHRAELREAASALPDAHPEWTDNWTLGADTRHMEILHVASRSVWLGQAPATQAQFEALVPPEGFVKTGIGTSVADAAWFPRSPDAERDGPLETIDVGGIRFSRVARPGIPEPGFSGVLVLPVHKHHHLFYRAGRTLEIMDFGDGFDHVPLVRQASGPAIGSGGGEGTPRVLPDGWSVREVTLARDLVVRLPTPTRVAFFANGESFQGPVRLGL